MDLEILPQPSEEERQAIVQALRMEAGDDRALSEWRRYALLTVDPDNDSAPSRWPIGDP